ncbi:MAG TPA: hypothetical protein VFM25_11970, partial [Verrucomicrobiae bacterium]|nr:hypothetical protein [Verrucomicrobiae bacterium]
PTAASYDGVFYQSTGAQLGQSGFIRITTTKKGKFSGLLQTGFGRYPFSGFFDDNGDAEIFGTPFEIQVSNSGDQITGTIGDGETWTADLVLDKNSFNAKKNPAPFAGRYTIVFPGSGDVNNTQIPFGSGYGSINVSKSGQARFQGVLADGTKVTQTTSVSDHGLWPLFVRLYHGGGQLLGLESFVSANPLSAPVNWIKEENDNARFYPDGFNFTTNSMGSPFNKTNAPITGFGVGTVAFSGGNLARDFSDTVFVTGKKVKNQSETRLTLKVNPNTGLFNGSAENPGAKKPVKFKGAILQEQSSGSGFFLGADQSGRVSVNP